MNRTFASPIPRRKQLVHCRNRVEELVTAVRAPLALRIHDEDLTVADRRVLPMLLSQGVGAETQRPLAAVVVGGLIGSIALTLVLLPLTCEWVRSRRSVGNCLQEGTAFVGRAYEVNGQAA
jgi:Cu/Ag efflux pump CusA